MSACSGRIIFLCINVVFWHVMGESAHTAAKSRTNLSTNSGKATKRLDQIWHTCADSSGNGYTPNKLPLVTKGGTWGVLGGKQFKSLGKLSKGWTDWHQLWFTSEDSYGNGHRLNTGMPVLIKLDQMVDSTWQASADLEGGEAPTMVIQLSHEQAISAQSCKQFNSILFI